MSQTEWSLSTNLTQKIRMVILNQKFIFYHEKLQNQPSRSVLYESFF